MFENGEHSNGFQKKENPLVTAEKNNLKIQALKEGRTLYEKSDVFIRKL